VRKFLAAYAKTASLPAAARSAKISVDWHYRLLEADSEYRKAFEAAQRQVVDQLEAEAFRRALNGSDELLVFLLRAWRPERYEQIVGAEHTGEIVLTKQDREFARVALSDLVEWQWMQ
jgi:hypothetical protein